MDSIRLSRDRHIKSEMAGGGFARVYSACSDEGADAVVKVIPKLPGAEQEHGGCSKSRKAAGGAGLPQPD